MGAIPGDYLLLTALDREWAAASGVLAPEGTLQRRIESATYDLFCYGIQRQYEASGEYLIAAAPMATWTPGQPYAAAFTQQALQHWQPDHLVLLGISGSLNPQQHQLGDVVVPTDIYGDDVREATDNGLLHRARRERTNASDLDRLRAFKRGRYYRTWQEACLREAHVTLSSLDALPTRAPELHLDEIVSGHVVVRSEAYAQEVQRTISKWITAVEMEMWGVLQATYLNHNAPAVLMIRGISDFADSASVHLAHGVGQAWRDYASANAARLLRALWSDEVNGDAPRSPGYRLNLTPGSAALFGERRCCDLLSRQTGAQNIAFPHLLDREGLPTPPSVLIVTATDRAGGPAQRFRGRCVLTMVPRQREDVSINGEENTPGVMTFPLPPAEDGWSLLLLLSFTQACKEISVRCKDWFGRTAETTLQTALDEP